MWVWFKFEIQTESNIEPIFVEKSRTQPDEEKV